MSNLNKKTEQCKLCGKKYSKKGLLSHIRLTHKNYTIKKYYDEFLKK